MIVFTHILNQLIKNEAVIPYAFNAGFMSAAFACTVIVAIISPSVNNHNTVFFGLRLIFRYTLYVLNIAALIPN